MKTALTIAGSDSGGGAGIQADIKTMTMNGVYAMSVITALTAQNTMGIRGIQEVSSKFLEQQLDAVFEDIFPDAVKIGMVSSGDFIRKIAERLKAYKAVNIVVDPVMISTSGSGLIAEEGIAALKNELFPLADIITPNIPEAEVLTGMNIRSEEDMLTAARRLSEAFGCAVLCKGGHHVREANDVLYQQKGAIWFYGKRIENPNNHGTGCTLSSAIASNLAKGFSMTESVRRAKDYISEVLSYQLNLGKGCGPMNHAFCLVGRYAENPK